MRIFPENLTIFEQKNNCFIANLIQTLTTEARVLNPKACGVQSCSPDGESEGWSPSPKKMNTFFLADWINS